MLNVSIPGVGTSRSMTEHAAYFAQSLLSQVDETAKTAVITYGQHVAHGTLPDTPVIDNFCDAMNGWQSPKYAAAMCEINRANPAGAAWFENQVARHAYELSAGGAQ